MLIAKTLSFYKRGDVRRVMAKHAVDKEVAVRYGEGFGKRPDVIKYPDDILEFAKRRATSFHCSEELWTNPLMLKPGMRRAELDELRAGWDLILDIDCTDWLFSKITAHLFVKALKEHGIKSITVKFSGNKGFHIAVPFEAFPAEANFNSKKAETKALFPEAPRAIAKRLLGHISDKHIKVEDQVISFEEHAFQLKELEKRFSKTLAELTFRKCKKCGKKAAKKPEVPEFICASCGRRETSGTEFLKCQKCGTLMTKVSAEDSLCECGSKEADTKFNPLSILEFDTLLLSSRHMYRMPYSFHEKSGLISLPVAPESIMSFEKEQASPEAAKMSVPFLNRETAEPGEGKELLYKALQDMEQAEVQADKKAYEIPGEAIPENFFPPCIKNILKGLQDGKKRSLFILQNFLACCGYGHEQTEKMIAEWNKRNEEPLREANVKGHLRYHKQRKEKILPPNCRSYYQDLRVCAPDNLCERIKNPVQYARKSAKFSTKK